MALYEKKEEKTEVKDDPAAKALLRQAFEKTSRWKKDFPGFSATLIFNDNGTVYKGDVRIKSRSDMTVNMELPPGKEALKKSIDEEIGMIVSHRAWRTFEEADGKHSVTFGATDAHPMGREILIHGDGMSSSYRLKDDRIRQISRTTPRMRFTINIEDVMTTDDGKALTTQYVVFYFSGDGKLNDVDSFTEKPCLFEGNYLPGIRRTITVDNGAAVVRILEFKNHKLLS